MSEVGVLEQFCRQTGQSCRAGERMEKHTTFRIGGPADLFIEAEDGAHAAAVMAKAHELGIRMTFIGRGSDLLVSDDGIRGAVLKLSGCAEPRLLDEAKILCPAGMDLAALCRFAQKHSLTGLEFAYGIPGSVGGAVYMNAGAYGGEMRDVVRGAVYYAPDGSCGQLGAEDLDFSYRHSWFTDHPGCLVSEAIFQLETGRADEILARMEDLLARRYAKQPLELPSAGSTFKRPQGGYASALIDQCGLKGRRVGGAVVSEKHAGFIVNDGGASCADVRELIAQVQKAVLEKTGFSLECEVRYIE